MNLSWGLSVWGLHVSHVHAWILSGYSYFLQQYKNMHIRLIGDSTLTLGVTVSVHGCVGPVMDCRLVLGVPCLSPWTLGEY